MATAGELRAEAARLREFARIATGVEALGCYSRSTPWPLSWSGAREQWAMAAHSPARCSANGSKAT